MEGTAATATSAASAVAPIWASPSSPTPVILPASRARAGTRARSTSTTRLAFSSSTPVSTMLPKMLMQKNSTMVMTVTAVSSLELRPATWPSSTLVTGTGASRDAAVAGLMPAAAARSRTVTSWMAPVTTALSCWSAWPGHSSRCAPATSTSARLWRTACSPAARLA